MINLLAVADFWGQVQSGLEIVFRLFMIGLVFLLRWLYELLGWLPFMGGCEFVNLFADAKTDWQAQFDQGLLWIFATLDRVLFFFTGHGFLQ